jgi:hypothetical protein
MVGIMQPKGNVHLNIGKPLTSEEIAQAALADKNDRYQVIRNAVDKRVIEGYRLWPNNYIAYDIINSTDRYAANYTEEEKAKFIGYMEHQLDTVEPEVNRDELREVFLGIYANPVLAKEELA